MGTPSTIRHIQDPVGEQIDGRVSRAEEPRTVRVGVKYHF
jgi:hypothetical protein